MRLHHIRYALLFVAALAARPVLADDAPWALVHWKPCVEAPVFQGAGGHAWDRKIRERGYVLFEEGIYRLWYTGYNDDRSPNRFLGLALSPDGLHWVRFPSNPLFTTTWTEDVCVVKHDGRYVLFAEGKEDIAHQLTSSDGLAWTDEGALDIRKTDGAPIAPGPRGTPAAWFENGTWRLLYERGDQGVWFATSPDRRVWTNAQDTPVLAMGPELYDRTAIAVNQVVKRDGFAYVFYHANAHKPWKDWTTCVARSRDLIHWEKYPGNPIIANNCSSAVLVTGPQGDRLYTMHPEVRVFEGLSGLEIPNDK